MARKPTDDVGKAQWKRIAATVKPLRRESSIKSPSPPGEGLGWGVAQQIATEKPTPLRLGSKLPSLTAPPQEGRGKTATPATQTLDSTWDRRLKTGRIEPDVTIDLHGHNLASAHTHLSRALDRAVGQGARTILLIAGKQRGPDEAPRGAIRRECETWLAHSRHAAKIAAVRNAHPRHGGAGALYLVLRRQPPL